DAPANDQQTQFSLGAVAAAVAVVVLGIAALGWGAVAAVASAHRNADLAHTQTMVRYVPATYRPAPAPGTAPAAELAPMGNWTPERGREIAQRALSWLNWPYSFGGGGPDGPSYGVPVDHDSRNDNKVNGFDCSGLTLYALAPFTTSLKHDAAAQYREVGSWHPALNSLQVGDLIFWSHDGTIDGIGHVAVYIGNGDVVQAPHSGDVVRITPIYQVESGDMGATRPLT
ncbi:MAG: peptidoglycan DL-endopeptidase RipA, partial [Pseudonocardiales bacterium]|nr:peptidoglycan DL-endopeptidase RipA [Pseudonocardiales bacterium]